MSKQPVKYWSTEIDAAKTASEIVSLIVRYGGERTSIDWTDGQPAAVTFIIRDRELGSIPVHIPARIDNVERLLLERVPWSGRGEESEYRQKLRERALRIVWRHLKDLIEQQLLAVEIGQYTLTDVFMTGVLVSAPDGGETTIGALVRSHADQVGLLRLPSGP